MEKTPRPEARGRPRAFDRDAALRRAMMVFWEQGYEGTSVDDLTTALGIAKPSLYAAFGCKEELFREAIALYDRAEQATVEAVLEEAPTARAAVETMLRANVDAYTDPGKPGGCMIVLAALIGTTVSRPVREHLAVLRRGAQADLERRLERAVRDGDLPATATPTALAAFYSTVLQGLSIQARDGASREDLTAIVDHAMAGWDQIAGSR